MAPDELLPSVVAGVEAVEASFLRLLVLPEYVLPRLRFDVVEDMMKTQSPKELARLNCRIGLKRKYAQITPEFIFYYSCIRDDRR